MGSLVSEPLLKTHDFTEIVAPYSYFLYSRSVLSEGAKEAVPPQKSSHITEVDCEIQHTAACKLSAANYLSSYSQRCDLIVNVCALSSH